MRADRLIATLLLLQARGRMSSTAIARELEVSPRTVMRDLEALGAAGVPIYSMRGPAGGYQLWEGFRAGLTGLTQDEVAAIPFWSDPSVAGLFGLDDALLRARLKVEMNISEAMIGAMADSASMFLRDTRVEGRAAHALPVLADAIVARRVLRCVHPQLADGGADLKPLAVVDRAGRWFLIADESSERVVLDAGEFDAVAVTGRRFTRPRFDVRAFWDEWRAREAPTPPPRS
jgi:predicted DNA-binding transcriptional regulator YafY